MASKNTQSPIEPGTLDPEYGVSLERLRSEMAYGATPDTLDYRKLFGLFLAGVLLVSAMVLFAFELYRYWDFKTGFKAAIAADYPDLRTLEDGHQQRLTTFGVIDSTAGVYHIPVDSAITLLVDEAGN